MAYVHYPLEDRIGFPVDRVLAAMQDAVTKIDAWGVEGRRVFVHCSAGLCRYPKWGKRGGVARELADVVSQ